MPVSIHLEYLPAAGGQDAKVRVIPPIPVPYSVDMYPDRQLSFVNRSPDKLLELRLKQSGARALKGPRRVLLWQDRTSAATYRVRKNLGIIRRPGGAFPPAQPPDPTHSFSAHFRVLDPANGQELDIEGQIGEADIVIEC